MAQSDRSDRKRILDAGREVPIEYGAAGISFEVMGSRGVYHEGWFACAFGPRRPWQADISGLIGWNPDEDEWQLHHRR